MVIHFRSGVFVAESNYAEKDAVKRAGWWWHGVDRDTGRCRPGCKACAAGLPYKVWWTPKVENAALLSTYADEEAKAALAGHVAEVEASRAMNVASDATFTVPAPEGLAYRPFQVAGIKWMTEHSRTLLGDEMGTGKSIEILGLINANPDIKSVLIICPASLRLNWRREAEKWLVRVAKIQIIDDEHPMPNPNADIVIANYDRIRNEEVHTALMARSWDLLAVDESHRVKNPKAKQTKAVLGSWDRENKRRIEGLIHRATRAVFATGTPIPNRPIELHPLLAALDSREWGNWKHYAERYCAAFKDRWGWHTDGAGHLEELQEKLRSSLLLRRLKKDVLSELPPKTRQLVPLAVNGAGKVVAAEFAAYAAYEDGIEQARAEMALADAADDEVAYAAAVQKLRAAQKVAFSEMARIRREVAVAKVPAALEHITDMLDGSEGIKLVVMAHHHEVIDALASGLKDYGVVLLTGETPMKERDAAVGRFQNDPTCRVFIGSITAAGVGLTLTASSTVIFVELSWTPADLTQAEDRVHRIGATMAVLIQHLVFDGSLDQKMAKLLVAKQAVADAALDKDNQIRLTEVERMASVSKTAWLALVKANLEKREEERKLAAAEAQMGADARAVHRAASKLVGDIEVADELRALVHEAVREIAVECDGAFLRDGVGFNKADSYLGRGLAALPSLNDKQAWLAVGLARRYRRQLGDTLRDRIAAVIGDTLDEAKSA
jgi:SWI/SNF-related matrix-associated actin-dependent regulator 1 of chromatin subfamily A